MQVGIFSNVVYSRWQTLHISEFGSLVLGFEREREWLSDSGEDMLTLTEEGGGGGEFGWDVLN